MVQKSFVKLPFLSLKMRSCCGQEYFSVPPGVLYHEKQLHWFLVDMSVSWGMPSDNATPNGSFGPFSFGFSLSPLWSYLENIKHGMKHYPDHEKPGWNWLHNVLVGVKGLAWPHQTGSAWGQAWADPVVRTLVESTTVWRHSDFASYQWKGSLTDRADEQPTSKTKDIGVSPGRITSLGPPSALTATPWCRTDSTIFSCGHLTLLPTTESAFKFGRETRPRQTSSKFKTPGLLSTACKRCVCFLNLSRHVLFP